MDVGKAELARQGGFKELVAWQKAMLLVGAVYRATQGWPRDELYGLTSQVRRAAVSIPSNLAEGHGRTGAREYAHHVSIAFGSLCELETQLLIAQELGYANREVAENLIGQTLEVRRLVRALLRSLNNRAPAEAHR
jgi:four helix bundle protein